MNDTEETLAENMKNEAIVAQFYYGGMGLVDYASTTGQKYLNNFNVCRVESITPILRC